jgi:hypothetical protein
MSHTANRTIRQVLRTRHSWHSVSAGTRASEEGGNDIALIMCKPVDVGIKAAESGLR